MQSQWAKAQQQIKERNATFDWSEWEKKGHDYNVESMQQEITAILTSHGYIIEWDVPEQKFEYNTGWVEEDELGFPISVYSAKDLANKLLRCADQHWSITFRARFDTNKQLSPHVWHALYYIMIPDDSLRLQAAIGKPVEQIDETKWNKELVLFGKNVVFNVLPKQIAAGCTQLVWHRTYDPQIEAVHRIYWKVFNEQGIPSHVKTADQFLQEIEEWMKKANKKDSIHLQFRSFRSIWHPEGEWQLLIGCT